MLIGPCIFITFRIVSLSFLTYTLFASKSSTSLHAHLQLPVITNYKKKTSYKPSKYTTQDKSPPVAVCGENIWILVAINI